MATTLGAQRESPANAEIQSICSRESGSRNTGKVRGADVDAESTALEAALERAPLFSHLRFLPRFRAIWGGRGKVKSQRAGFFAARRR